ncbi:MAG: hypothetical protein AAF682_13430 [Planctomycetota bacterium]
MPAPKSCRRALAGVALLALERTGGAPPTPVQVVDLALRRQEGAWIATALGRAGLEVESPWDLIYVDGGEYAEAVPVLLHLLVRVREWDSLSVLSRLLRIKEARRGVPPVLYEKLAVSDTDVRGRNSMGAELAATMAYLATPRDFDGQWSIVRDEGYSRYVRGPIIEGIVRLARKEERRSEIERFLLRQLGTAEEMRGWAGCVAHALGVLKSRRALPGLRRMRKDGESDFERRRAKQAIAKIEKGLAGK